MSTTYHTPHPFGNDVDSAEFNSRLGQLDAAIGATAAAGFVDAASTLDTSAAAGTRTLSLVSVTGYRVGDSVYVGAAGSGLAESHIVKTINAGTNDLTIGGSNVTLALSAAADDIVDTATAHGFAAGDVVVFDTLTGGTGLSANTPYFVIAANLGSTTFQVSLTSGGAAINFTTDITAGTVYKAQLANTHAIGTPVSRSPAEIVAARGTHPTLASRLTSISLGTFNVLAYGASGNGTDNDTSAIQSAIDAAGAGGGGVVYFPEGDYLVNAALNLTSAEVVLLGSGLGSTIVTTTAHTVVNITGARCRVVDLAITMPTATSTASTSRGIYFGAGSTGAGGGVWRCRLTGGYMGIAAENTGYLTIEENELLSFVYDGIYLGGAASLCRVVGNEVHNGCTNIPAGVGIGGGIMLNTATDNLVADNNVYSNGTASPNGGAGIWINQSHRNRILGNRCVANGKAGLDLNGQGIVAAGSGGSTYNSIVGNYCAQNESEGITLFQEGTSFNTVSGNVSRANGLNNIEVWGAAFNTVTGNTATSSVGGVGIMLNKGAEASGANHCTVANNIVASNHFNGIQVTDSTDALITGNSCIDNGRSASVLTYEASGILLNGASTGCVVTANVATDLDAVTASKKQLYGLSILNTSSALGGDNRFTGNKTGEVENTQLASGNDLGYVEGTETSDPTAPAANRGRLYFRDNGAGKTQLVVRFATGAIQVVSTEP